MSDLCEYCDQPAAACVSHVCRALRERDEALRENAANREMFLQERQWHEEAQVDIEEAQRVAQQLRAVAEDRCPALTALSDWTDIVNAHGWLKETTNA